MINKAVDRLVGQLGLDGFAFVDIKRKIKRNVNKNAVVGDTSALSPGGIRIGTSAMVSRGLTSQEDWNRVALFFQEAVLLAQSFTTSFGV